MVATQGPEKFYGSSLPKPRIYTDIKFNDEWVDPSFSVTDPLMAWADEAHWSMGGLSFNDSDDDEDNKDSSPLPPPASMTTKWWRQFMAVIEEEDVCEDVDLGLNNLKGGENGAEGDEVGVRKMRTLARKLGDDFDRVATESGLEKSKGSLVKSLSNGSETVALQTQSRRIEESDGGDEVVKVVKYVKKTNSKGRKLKRVGEKEKAKSVAESGSSTPAGKTRTSLRLAMRRLCSIIGLCGYYAP
ncbi:hypothetical protein LOK49_LG11G01631 [Camellia lanceoleosa]|uniref:Uncharacterized protein n=1 Tax=Camellia lanceoleosa TaxID=1840588 RepID=A0ACC0G1K7_9ERIC|nr:hypothetical protein LOK49_LG11G01631 [Camellia lanceoleosa]